MTYRQNYIGLKRKCGRCPADIIVDEKMQRRSQYWCKPCRGEATMIYVRKNREKKRRWNREYFARNPDKRVEYTRAARKRHPVKARARWAVGNALRRGNLVRQPCFCGSIKSEAHHADYTKPLDVVWLCRVHHREAHR